MSIRISIRRSMHRTMHMPKHVYTRVCLHVYPYVYTCLHMSTHVYTHVHTQASRAIPEYLCLALPPTGPSVRPCRFVSDPYQVPVVLHSPRCMYVARHVCFGPVGTSPSMLPTCGMNDVCMWHIRCMCGACIRQCMVDV